MGEGWGRGGEGGTRQGRQALTARRNLAHTTGVGPSGAWEGDTCPPGAQSYTSTHNLFRAGHRCPPLPLPPLALALLRKAQKHNRTCCFLGVAEPPSEQAVLSNP